jgi:hypothetical protein
MNAMLEGWSFEVMDENPNLVVRGMQLSLWLGATWCLLQLVIFHHLLKTTIEFCSHTFHVWL